MIQTKPRKKRCSVSYDKRFKEGFCFQVTQCNLVNSSTLFISSSTETFIVFDISSILFLPRSRNDSIKSPSKKFLESAVFFSL
ncbi:hypothetical protein Hanom_Chr15g01364181 [Helianthus anomalus]